MGTVFQWENEPDLDRLKLAFELRKSDQKRSLEEFRYLAEIGSVNSMIYLGEAFRG